MKVVLYALLIFVCSVNLGNAAYQIAMDKSKRSIEKLSTKPSIKWEPFSKKKSIVLDKLCKKLLNITTKYEKKLFNDPTPEDNKDAFICLFNLTGVFDIVKGWNADRLHAQIREWSKLEDLYIRRIYVKKSVDDCLKNDNANKTAIIRAYELFKCTLIYVTLKLVPTAEQSERNWQPFSKQKSLAVEKKCKEELNIMSRYEKTLFNDPTPEENKDAFLCLFNLTGVFDIAKGWNAYRLHAQLREWSKWEEIYIRRIYLRRFVDDCLKKDKAGESAIIRTYELYNCVLVYFKRRKIPVLKKQDEWKPFQIKKSLAVDKECKALFNIPNANKKIIFMDTSPEENKQVFLYLFNSLGVFDLKNGWNADRLHDQLHEWSTYTDGPIRRFYVPDLVDRCLCSDKAMIKKETLMNRAYEVYKCSMIYMYNSCVICSIIY